MSRADTSPALRLEDLDIPTAVSLVGAAVDRRVLESLSAAGHHGLRPGHGHVIQRLVDGPSTIGEISDAIGVTQQAVSKTVKELVELGYVEQTTDAADRRRRPLRLTRAGRSAVATARRARSGAHEEVRASVSARDLAATRRVLAQLARTLGIDQDVARRSVPVPPERT